MADSEKMKILHEAALDENQTMFRSDETCNGLLKIVLNLQF